MGRSTARFSPSSRTPACSEWRRRACIRRKCRSGRRTSCFRPAAEGRGRPVRLGRGRPTGRAPPVERQLPHDWLCGRTDGAARALRLAFNVNQPDLSNAQVFGKLYFGDLNEMARGKWRGSLPPTSWAVWPGPACSDSKIYFVSNRTGAKEIWSMDYDGTNQKQIDALRLDFDLPGRLAGRHQDHLHDLTPKSCPCCSCPFARDSPAGCRSITKRRR